LPVNRLVRIALLLGALSPTVALAQVDYHRADLIRTAPSRLLGVPELAGGLAVLGVGHPNWLDDSTRFWYRVKSVRGQEFVLVDPTRLTRRLVFDNARLAAALSLASDSAIDPVKLPLRTFSFLPSER